MEDQPNNIKHWSVHKMEDRFPRIVAVIVLAEFCERFSYSGMRAFLTLYLRSKLNYTDDGATEMYHIFSMLVYLFPIFGGILADNYLGKYKTILYMMFVYASGNVLVAVTAIPQLHIPGRLCTLLGLLLITVGTGGIKPCVTAFGGDQFRLPSQERHLAAYFSVLYFTLCVGSLIAKSVSPILRSEVRCFGDKDCYSLAFGAPGLIVVLSIVIFVSAKSKYTMKKPQGNVVFDFVRCVFLGIRSRLVSRPYEKIQTERRHWLDSAIPRYGHAFVEDVKKTLSILSLFAVLPVFWALLDQMGSRWTLQATKMDGRLWGVTIKPDQMQVAAPVCILIIIPTFHKIVYPFLEKRSMLRNPLHKLMLGGILAGVAFIVSGILELYLQTTYPELPRPGVSQLRIYNGYDCPVSIQTESQLTNMSYIIPSLSVLVYVTPTPSSSTPANFRLSGACVLPTDLNIVLEDNQAVSYFLHDNKVDFYLDNVEKSRTGYPVVRSLVSDNCKHLNLTLYNERNHEVELFIKTGVSDLNPVFPSRYSIRNGSVIYNNDIEIESGGVYAVVVNCNDDLTVRSELVVVSAANSVPMALLLPQFIIMSVAEVMFAVTGNEFAFRESPGSMRAVMTAVWLLTEAAGNLLIILVTRICADYSQATQSFLYAGAMFLSMAAFHFMSRTYCKGKRRNEDAHTQDTKYAVVPQAEDTQNHKSTQLSSP